MNEVIFYIFKIAYYVLNDILVLVFTKWAKTFFL